MLNLLDDVKDWNFWPKSGNSITIFFFFSSAALDRSKLLLLLSSNSIRNGMSDNRDKEECIYALQTTTTVVDFNSVFWSGYSVGVVGEECVVCPGCGWTNTWSYDSTDWGHLRGTDNNKIEWTKTGNLCHSQVIRFTPMTTTDHWLQPEKPHNCDWPCNPNYLLIKERNSKSPGAYTDEAFCFVSLI